MSSGRNTWRMLALAAGLTLSWAGAGAQTSSPSVDAPPLTLAGAALPAVAASLSPLDVRVSVDLQGDVPLATYVSARIGTAQLVQRTPAGQWVAWDGRDETRINDQFAAFGGRLTFVVNGTGTDFSAPKFPVAVFIGYRTAAGLKFGYFTVTAQP
ncbi:MAG TPA: hypothetical protein VMH36_23110 [Alphaproteobacteria bacterium]|nr:hypothetical protein [Alphaproteobacteria bacterium]